MAVPDTGVERPLPALLGLDEVLVVSDVVTAAEQHVLCTWTDHQRAAGRLLVHPVDPTTMSTPFRSAADRQLTRLTGSDAGAAEASLVWVPATDPRVLDPLPDEFWAVRSGVVDRLGIADLPDDPYKGSFLTSVTAGGGVHAHKDARLPIDGEPHPLLRCNVVVRRPVSGGLPVIEGTEFDVPERGMWAFHPTENEHRATAVTGPIGRITLSFGFVVDPRRVWERSLRVAEEVEPAVLQGVRAQLRGQQADPDRTRVLNGLLGHTEAFRLREAAEALGCEPAVVWAAARRLVRLGLLRSAAPEPVAGGKRHAL